MMFGLYIDLFIVFASLFWIIFTKIKLMRMMPCVCWAFKQSDVDIILSRGRLKAIFTLVFSLLCLIFFAIRFYLVLRFLSASGMVCFLLPILCAIYGGYVVFFRTIYSLLNEEKQLPYKQYLMSIGIGK
ncbi:hypothetical protein [Acinetobacter chengduensis]|uniref:Uncharacterized protein n=1 Tax=Acinetobacter chengduensis TaxID=2420890 RepID=A0ABX9TSJ9_9GAMM|nr:hypothetical protein [Acinetobacter chengduensis]RLL18993.1 hypothetical protein D9K81_14645 [Acinetobacter chengduensis]